MMKLKGMEAKTFTTRTHSLMLAVFLCFLTLATGARADMALAPGDAAQLQVELFAAFERNGKTEKFGSVFNKLPDEYKKKTLAYFKAGRSEQSNEIVLLRGIYNLMNYYRDIRIIMDALAHHKKTGKFPTKDMPSVGLSAAMAANAFPGGGRYVDRDKASQFDDFFIAENRKSIAEDRKSIDLMNTLLKALDK